MWRWRCVDTGLDTGHHAALGIGKWIIGACQGNLPHKYLKLSVKSNSHNHFTFFEQFASLLIKLLINPVSTFALCQRRRPQSWEY